MKSFELLGGGGEKREKKKIEKNHTQRLLANSVYSTLNIFPLPPPKIVNIVSIRNFQTIIIDSTREFFKQVFNRVREG